MRFLTLSAIFLLLAAVALQAAPVPTGDWNELIDVTQLPYFKDGIVTQTSSFDRTGGNDDGFSGAFSFIRKEGEDFVIFDEQGPGCIYRIWSANPGKGWVKVYFDGETTPRIDVEHFEDLFLGQYQPFVSPIARHFLGGWCSYVPVPFEKSCKIVAQGPVKFLQITWQKFPSDRKVKTFSREMSPDEQAKFNKVVDVWSKLGENPWPVVNARTERVAKTLKGNKSTVLTDLSGPGMVRGVQLKIDSKDERILRKALFEVYTDGIEKPTVWSPVGDFFLDGFGQNISQSLLLGKKDGTYYCYFPMPFEKSIKIKVTSQSKADVKLDASIIWEPLKESTKDMGRFFAWWHRQNPTVDGELFPILEATGRGHWCGVSHAMFGRSLGFLEGDELLWIDDRDNTYYNGTGTEDYFNGGWYFGTTGNAALYGCGVLEDQKCLAFRLHLTDYVPFQQKATIGIEHGHANESKADYAGVSYWYAEPVSTHTFASAPLNDRMPSAMRLPNVVEAEDALTSSDAQIISDADLIYRFSASKAVAVKSSGAPPSISLKADVPESGNFFIEGQLVASPKGGLVQILVDGKKAGEPINTQAAQQGIMPIAKLSDLPWLKKGTHEITFSMLKDGKRDYELIVDCIRIKESGLIEGEDLKVIANSNGRVSEQQLGEAWSNGSHLWCRTDEPGNYFTLELPVEKTKVYTIYVYLTMAADYGIAQFKLDGKPIGQSFDGYHSDGVIRSGRIELGTMELTAGNHEFTFEVTGKNEKSSSYMVGIDAILLR